MKISARNLIKNKIVAAWSGKVVSNVELQITINSNITTAT
jgi:molybdopterin-binding protein